MFIHWENALKAQQHNYIISLFYTKRALKKKKLIQNLIKIFTKVAHFFKIFSQGSMPLSMCAADIIVSI